jgi:hypothetical protein
VIVGTWAGGVVCAGEWADGLWAGGSCKAGELVVGTCEAGELAVGVGCGGRECGFGTGGRKTTIALRTITSLTHQHQHTTAIFS